MPSCSHTDGRCDCVTPCQSIESISWCPEAMMDIAARSRVRTLVPLLSCRSAGHDIARFRLFIVDIYQAPSPSSPPPPPPRAGHQLFAYHFLPILYVRHDLACNNSCSLVICSLWFLKLSTTEPHRQGRRRGCEEVPPGFLRCQRRQGVIYVLLYAVSLLWLGLAIGLFGC